MKISEQSKHFVSLSPSGEDMPPIQAEGEKRFFRSLEEIAGFYDEDAGYESFDHIAFLLIEPNPREPEYPVKIFIDDHLVGYLKPGHAKKYIKRLILLGAPTDAIGVCGARISGGKSRGEFKTGFGVRLDFDIKLFEIGPYPPPSRQPIIKVEPAPISVQLSAQPGESPKTDPRVHHPRAKPKRNYKFPFIPLKGSGAFYWLIVFPVVFILNCYVFIFVGLWFLIVLAWDFISGLADHTA